MKRWIHTACLAAALTLASLGTATAAPTVFVLGDHPDGDLAADGAYGLRLDETLWSMAGVELTFDAVLETASLEGSVFMTSTNVASRMQDDPEEWYLTYTFSGVSALGSNSFTATGGEGWLIDQHTDHIDYFDYIFLQGKQDAGLAFIFGPNGWRLEDWAPPFDSVDGLTGRGWLMATNVVYGVSEWKCEERLGGRYRNGKCKVDLGGTQDFLVTAMDDDDTPPVPEPSTILLTMGGVALLWFRKRSS
jgi:hypothetical protein